MEVLLGVLVFLPLLLSIIEGNGRNGTSALMFMISIAISATFMMFSGKFIGWLAIILGLALHYFIFYKIDDEFKYFLDKKVFGKKA